MMHLPEGHLKYFTLSVWPAHRIGCVHWYKPLCSWDFTLSCRFLYFLEEKKKKVEDMLDRDYWHKRQKAQTLCWSQIAVQSLWPSWRVSNQKFWNGVVNLPGRLMSSVLDKEGNYVLSLLWDVLGNLGHILESMEGIKCRVEPADKCATGFSLYLLWEAGQLHRKIFDCWQRAYNIIMLIWLFLKTSSPLLSISFIRFFLQIIVTIILSRHWYNGCSLICHLFMWQVGLAKQLGKRTAFLIGVRK